MKIIKGRKRKPLCIMIYGVHGIGKTTLPMEAPNPIYIGNEENDEFDVARFEENVSSWNDFISQLNFLLKSDHDYQTLVIDAIDSLQEVAKKEILKNQKGKTMATAYGGFGKAYDKMYEMFFTVKDKYLKPLRNKKGMNIVLLAHAEKTKHEDPMSLTSFDHYSTSLHKKLKPLFEDWVSAIFFATWQLYSTETSDGKQTVTGEGERILLTEERPSHIAKNRFNLPDEIEFKKTGTWNVLNNHINKYYECSNILQKIRDSFAKISNKKTKEKITLAIKKANNNDQELNRIYEKMQTLGE